MHAHSSLQAPHSLLPPLSCPMAHPIHQATKTSPYGHLTKEEFYEKHQVQHQEAFMDSAATGAPVFTQTWLPAGEGQPLLGVVAMIHGYACESGWLFELTAVAIAKLGFLACALDMRGHGRSAGRRGHLPDIRPVVADCAQFFGAVRAAHPRLPAFLYGESLGGAVAVLTCLHGGRPWDGLVLNGAMCGVSAAYKPPWPLEKLLPLAALLAPSWRVAVTRPLPEVSYRDARVRGLARRAPRAHASGRAPAATAAELLRVCAEVSRRCGELDVPMLVLHGERDAVCDARAARRVWEAARARDKTFRLVPGMWHQLVGEPGHVVDAGFGCVFSWLLERAKQAAKTP